MVGRPGGAGARERERGASAVDRKRFFFSHARRARHPCLSPLPPPLLHTTHLQRLVQVPHVLSLHKGVLLARRHQLGEGGEQALHAQAAHGVHKLAGDEGCAFCFLGGRQVAFSRVRVRRGHGRSPGAWGREAWCGRVGGVGRTKHAGAGAKKKTRVLCVSLQRLPPKENAPRPVLDTMLAARTTMVG